MERIDEFNTLFNPTRVYALTELISLVAPVVDDASDPYVSLLAELSLVDKTMFRIQASLFVKTPGFSQHSFVKNSGRGDS